MAGAVPSMDVDACDVEVMHDAEPPRHRTVNEFTPGVSVVDAIAERRAAAGPMGLGRRRDSVGGSAEEEAVAAETALAPADAVVLGELLAGLSWPRPDRDGPDVEEAVKRAVQRAASSSSAATAAGGAVAAGAGSATSAAAAGEAADDFPSLPGLLQLRAGTLRLPSSVIQAAGGPMRGDSHPGSPLGTAGRRLARRSSSSGSSGISINGNSHHNNNNNNIDSSDNHRAVDIPRRRRVSRLLGWAARALEVRRRALTLGASGPALSSAPQESQLGSSVMLGAAAAAAAAASAPAAAAGTSRRPGNGSARGCVAEGASGAAAGQSAGAQAGARRGGDDDEDASSELSSIADVGDRQAGGTSSTDPQFGSSSGRRAGAGGPGARESGLQDMHDVPGSAVSYFVDLMQEPSADLLDRRLSDEAAILRLRQALLGERSGTSAAPTTTVGGGLTGGRRGAAAAGQADHPSQGLLWMAGLAPELGPSTGPASPDLPLAGGEVDDIEEEDDDASDLSSSDDSFEELDAADEDEPGHESGEAILQRLALAAARAGREADLAGILNFPISRRVSAPNVAPQARRLEHIQAYGSAAAAAAGPRPAGDAMEVAFDIDSDLIDDSGSLGDDDDDDDDAGEGSAGRDAESVVSSDIPLLGEPLLDMLPQVIGEDGEVVRLVEEVHRLAERSVRTVARPLILPGRLRPMGDVLAAAAEDESGRAAASSRGRRGDLALACSRVRAVPFPVGVPLSSMALPSLPPLIGAATPETRPERPATSSQPKTPANAAPAADWLRSALASWPGWRVGAQDELVPLRAPAAVLQALDQCLTGAWDRQMASCGEAPSANPRSLKPLASLLSFADIVTVLKATLDLRCSIRQRLLEADFDGASGLLLSRVPFLAGRMVAGVIAADLGTPRPTTPTGTSEKGAGGLLLVRLVCAAVLQRAARSADGGGSCLAELSRRAGPMVRAMDQDSPDHEQATKALAHAAEALAWVGEGAGDGAAGRLKAALLAATDAGSLADQCNRTVVNGFLMLRAQRRLADAVGATGRAHRRRRRDAVATAAALQRASALQLPWSQGEYLASERGTSGSTAPPEADGASGAAGRTGAPSGNGAATSWVAEGAARHPEHKSGSLEAQRRSQAPRLADAALTLHLMRWPARIEGPLPTSALERAVKHTVLVRHLLWVASGSRGPRFAIPTAEEAALAFAA